ncbi:MAG: hypothetical protein KC422_15615 [Trueperaceae bacterium]|nr:hypothetical protein [Trueperaceae bacterium]
MIITKTPLRIPLAGGLSDIKLFAEPFGGATVSSTINKFTYVNLKENLGGYFRLRYQDVQEKVSELEHIKHDLIREAIRLMGLENEPLDIVIMSDLAGESGLGTSGSVTVSLLNAMHRYKGEHVSKQQLLEEASHIEVDILEGASGYHDPSICALGGLKLIEYGKGSIVGRDIPLSTTMRQRFQDSLLFFYGGRHHKSKPSLDLLSGNIERAIPTLKTIKGLAYELEQAFLSEDLAQVACLIGEMQNQKQQLPGKFLDDYVLDITKRVRDLGAYAQLPGGKISAFVIVCCPNKEHDAVREALKDLTEVKLELETEGAKALEI